MSSVPFDETLIAPIGGDAQVGRDLSYEPAFQALQAEVDQAAALAGRMVNWQLVHVETTRMLREESKDLRLASWWFVATAHLEGWPGLARALGFYQSMLEVHWDGMFPTAKRARARAGLVQWVWEGSRKALSAREPTAAEMASVRTSLDALGEVDRILAGRLGELNPGTGPLRALLREKAESFVEPAPVAAPAPVNSPAPAPPAAAAQHAAAEPVPPLAPAVPVVARANALLPEHPPAVTSSEDVRRATTQWREPLSALAAAGRVADPTSPLPYRLVRAAAWLAIDVPPDVEDGKTFIRPPRSDDARDLRALFERADWATLRDAAESTLSDHIFWLDLHYLTGSALERLGPSYAAARAVVLHETLAFLDRIPGLESMRFRDGTPFATPPTLAWLHAKRVPITNGEAPRPDAGGAGDAASAILSDARRGCAEGKVGDALAAALSRARGLATGRQRFRARLDLAGLALGEGRKEVALAILDRLLGEIDAALEAWEPDLCAEILSAFLIASSFRAGSAEGAPERQRLLFGRLLQLDPVSALRIAG
jgi:type VI secretion system protein VasJ